MTPPTNRQTLRMWTAHSQPSGVWSLPGIETWFLKFDGDGSLCVFKGFFTFPDGCRQEIVATLSIVLFIQKSLDEAGQGSEETLYFG